MDGERTLRDEGAWVKGKHIAERLSAAVCWCRWGNFVWESGWVVPVAVSAPGAASWNLRHDRWVVGSPARMHIRRPAHKHIRHPARMQPVG